MTNKTSFNKELFDSISVDDEYLEGKFVFKAKSIVNIARSIYVVVDGC
jgi:hypothetical protein